MAVTSNVLELNRDFLDLVDGFDLNLPGKDQSLGRDMATVVATGIIERTVADGEDATGGTLKPNAPKYAAMKARKHDVHQPNILTGQMLSLESVRGEVVVEADQVTIRYGTGTPPTRYSTRGDIKGNEPTDRQKAQFCTDGGRPFFALDDRISAEIRTTAQEALAEYLSGA